MKNIGVICALSIEKEEMTKSFGIAVSETKIGNFIVSQYKYEDKTLTVLLSGAGEIMASAGTEILISLYKVEIIINYGICGQITDGEVLNKTVVEFVVHYDYDTSAIDSTVIGQYPNYTSPLIETDKSLVNLVCNIDSCFKKVICASGDKFISTKEQKHNLVNSFSAEICEMEAAAVLLVSNSHSIPCLILKVVSDSGDNATEFLSFVKNCKMELVDILRKIIAKL